MKCEYCAGTGVILKSGNVCDCITCCGTGICPIAEVGATQAAIDWLRAELYATELAFAQRMKPDAKSAASATL